MTSKQQPPNDSTPERSTPQKLNPSTAQPLLQTLTPAFRLSILLIICLIAFCVRIFSVIRYESIIHEFDPWFNYRATRYLSEKGREEFSFWFDADSWYPLGRFVGHTVFPGLMYTTVAVEKALKFLLVPLDIKDICVFTAPVFSTITAFTGYLLTTEIYPRPEAGLLSALFLAVVPSYLSRSVAGSFDNEAISITQLVMTFYLFLKAAKQGSMLWAALCGLSYAYLVSSWGGYHFVIIFIPTFVLALIIVKKFDTNIYIAYNVFYVVGSFWSMQTKFVEFKVFSSSEHLMSHFVFVLSQGVLLFNYFKAKLSEEDLKSAVRYFLLTGAAIATATMIYLGLMGKTRFSERVMTLLDPNYAKNYIPIVASVSEHQPTSWATFFFDLQFLLVFSVVGLYFCLQKTTPAKLFIAFYMVVCIYLASLMIRLLLVVAPALCILSGIGVSKLMRKAIKAIVNSPSNKKQPESESKGTSSMIRFLFGAIVIAVLAVMSIKFVLHGSIVGAEVYSSPSVILSNRDYKTGSKVIIDDFREAYYWLRQNSVERSKVMSWWDYGYQIAGFSNRTTICDNNTWNFTHIAYVGKVFSSSEEEGYQIMENLDIDYVLVIFGGKTGYGGDDINKFLWIIRIAGNTFPSIKESDFTTNGYRVDSAISPTFKNSIMYKLNYYRFWEEDNGRGKGFDAVRNARIGHTHYKLKYFEEVFTSRRWLIRIYKRKSKTNREEVAFAPKDVSQFPIAYDPKEDPETSFEFL